VPRAVERLYPHPPHQRDLRQDRAAKRALAVISNNPSRALKYPLDKHLYAQRHLVECCFSKLKQLRRVATRFEKPPEITAPSSLSLLSSYGSDKCPHRLVLEGHLEAPVLQTRDSPPASSGRSQGRREDANPCDLLKTIFEGGGEAFSAAEEQKRNRHLATACGLDPLGRDWSAKARPQQRHISQRATIWPTP
jgi:transposase